MENILLMFLGSGISTIIFGIWGFAESYTKNEKIVQIGFATFLICTVASWILCIAWYTGIYTLITKFITLLF